MAEGITLDEPYLGFVLTEFRAEIRTRTEVVLKIRSRAEMPAQFNGQATITVTLADLNAAMDEIQAQIERRREQCNNATRASGYAGAAIAACGMGALVMIGNVASLPIIYATTATSFAGGLVASRAAIKSFTIDITPEETRVRLEQYRNDGFQ